ncbi:MAG: ester cyclase [Candidatus Bathyarchaeota archaeon]|nr:MAG: ester cyclase [Candidatus Bathyarchaeota archaeon]
MAGKIKDLVAEEDKVWVLFSVEGTHSGEWRGLVPTGKKIVISRCVQIW